MNSRTASASVCDRREEAQELFTTFCVPLAATAAIMFSFSADMIDISGGGVVLVWRASWRESVDSVDNTVSLRDRRRINLLEHSKCIRIRINFIESLVR